MSLTNDDLKAIREAMKPDFDSLNERIDKVESDLLEVKSDIKTIKKDVIEIRYVLGYENLKIIRAHDPKEM